MGIPAVAEEMVGRVRDRTLVARYLVVPGFTEKGAARNVAIRVGIQRAFGRQNLVPPGAVMLVVSQQRDLGAVAGVPRHLRRNQPPIVGREINLCVTVAHQPKQAILPHLVMIEGAGGVDISLAPIVAAEDASDLRRALRLRPLGDLVDETARGHLAIKH